MNKVFTLQRFLAFFVVVFSSSFSAALRVTETRPSTNLCHRWSVKTRNKRDLMWYGKHPSPAKPTRTLKTLRCWCEFSPCLTSQTPFAGTCGKTCRRLWFVWSNLRFLLMKNALQTKCIIIIDVTDHRQKLCQQKWPAAASFTTLIFFFGDLQTYRKCLESVGCRERKKKNCCLFFLKIRFVGWFHSWQFLAFFKFLVFVKEKCICRCFIVVYYYHVSENQVDSICHGRLLLTRRRKIRNTNLNRILFCSQTAIKKNKKKQSAQTHKQCAHTSGRRHFIQLWHVVSLFLRFFSPPPTDTQVVGSYFEASETLNWKSVSRTVLGSAASCVI